MYIHIYIYIYIYRAPQVLGRRSLARLIKLSHLGRGGPEQMIK